MKEFCIGIVMLQCVPLKGFGSAVCLQRVRYILYIMPQTADPNSRNSFRGTNCTILDTKQIKQIII